MEEQVGNPYVALQNNLMISLLVLNLFQYSGCFFLATLSFMDSVVLKKAFTSIYGYYTGGNNIATTKFFKSSFFEEGIFYKVYNQGAYLMQKNYIR